MAFQADIDEDNLLSVTYLNPNDDTEDVIETHDVCIISFVDLDRDSPHTDFEPSIESVSRTVSRAQHLVDTLPDEAAVGFLIRSPTVPYLFSALENVSYQRSIALRLKYPLQTDIGLDNEFFSLAFFSKGYDSFSISKVRTAYRYCAQCDKTTKDYGGKKHLYHSFGTLQRDVWKHPDIQIDPTDPLSDQLVDRIRATFSSGRHSRLLVISYEQASELDEGDPALSISRFNQQSVDSSDPTSIDIGTNEIIEGDAVDLLKQTPSESVDLVFLDPPYNIGKEYEDYDDSRELEEYYQWCEDWLAQVTRVTKPGGVVVSLNLPEAIYHQVRYLSQELSLVNWICWDALSRPPAGNIMPTNYPILVFAKGEPKSFNYEPLDMKENELFYPDSAFEYETIYPLDDRFCKRNSCIESRRRGGVLDRKELTTLWTDVFRLKHNSQREDHPTMLPPKLVRRLLWLFTDPGDTVLDPFNGVGTTTLTAAQLNRQFTGFEISSKYADIARQKHRQLKNGIDPFEKQSASISPPVSEDTEYEIPKKDLQLEVKRIAKQLGHVPERDEVIEHGKYPIDYYDKYFDGWADVTKAARTTGMSEDKDESDVQTTLFNYDE